MTKTPDHSIEANVTTDIDLNVLRIVQPILWKPGPLTELMLALEVMEGPYTGVVFSFTTFQIDPDNAKEGMLPVKYEIRVFSAPSGFVHDEAFDQFTSELLMAWLTHLATTDYKKFATLPASGVH